MLCWQVIQLVLTHLGINISNCRAISMETYSSDSVQMCGEGCLLKLYKILIFLFFSSLKYLKAGINWTMLPEIIFNQCPPTPYTKKNGSPQILKDTLVLFLLLTIFPFYTDQERQKRTHSPLHTHTVLLSLILIMHTCSFSLSQMPTFANLKKSYSLSYYSHCNVCEFKSFLQLFCHLFFIFVDYLDVCCEKESSSWWIIFSVCKHFNLHWCWRPYIYSPVCHHK